MGLKYFHTLCHGNDEHFLERAMHPKGEDYTPVRAASKPFQIVHYL